MNARTNLRAGVLSCPDFLPPFIFPVGKFLGTPNRKTNKKTKGNTQTWTWHGKDDKGQILSAGIYLVALSTSQDTQHLLKLIKTM